jgi:hypothetical protein
VVGLAARGEGCALFFQLTAKLPHMKKLYLTAAFALLISCSNGDDTVFLPQPQPNVFNLTGRWNLKSKISNGHAQSLSGCEQDYNWYQFGADNAAIIGRFNLYSQGGNNFCNQATGQGSYSVAGTVLTYSGSTATYIEKFNIISANSLTIQLEKFSYTDSGGQHNIPANDRIIEICNKAE